MDEHRITDIRQGHVQEVLDFYIPGQTPKTGIGSAFYRGKDCHFNPYHADHLAPDFAARFLLDGWLPAERFITSRSRITAFGSCFAQNISAHLSAIDFQTAKDIDKDIYVSRIGEGMVNVYALLEQFEWALENKQPPEDLWHGYRAEDFGYDEDIRQRTAAVFRATDVFIITLGLSEVWYDAQTGGVFWRAVPLRHYDPARHRFRVLSFAETKAALQRMLRLVERHVPGARLIFTLSPVPLAATFRNVSCLTANSVSKAILRAALDETLRESPAAAGGRVHYFPAYEAVNELFVQPFEPDGRHFRPFVIPAIMHLFEAHYCQTALTPREAEVILREARQQNARQVADHPLYDHPLYRP